MDRVALDARKNSEKLHGFYELPVDTFNNETCVLESTTMVGVDRKFAEPLKEKD